ncbi:helix-turn-helix domain-containing protein [Tropicimonas sp. IMCC6043]|nr:helix-turn-helix domain-containing protein [Tropicimonas sp. IMCC6043]
MDRQTLGDWGHRFNAKGPDGLVNRKESGSERRLNAVQLNELEKIVEAGPERPLRRSRTAAAARQLNGSFGPFTKVERSEPKVRIARTPDVALGTPMPAQRRQRNYSRTSREHGSLPSLPINRTMPPLHPRNLRQLQRRPIPACLQLLQRRLQLLQLKIPLHNSQTIKERHVGLCLGHADLLPPGNGQNGLSGGFHGLSRGFEIRGDVDPYEVSCLQRTDPVDEPCRDMAVALVEGGVDDIGGLAEHGLQTLVGEVGGSCIHAVGSRRAASGSRRPVAGQEATVRATFVVDCVVSHRVAFVAIVCAGKGAVMLT